MLANILLWAGIALIVIGWIELARQAAKIMTLGKETQRFPEKRKTIFYKRNVCRLVILGGTALVMISLFA